MTMLLRILLAGLVLAHGLVWAWGHGWLGGAPRNAQREPERLALQAQPERLQWLSPKEQAQAREPAPVCREVGPLPDEAAVQRARTPLQAQGLNDTAVWVWSQPGEWAVATREADDADELARKKQVLARAGVSAQAERLRGDTQPSWVVSRHSDRAAAQAELARLRETKGLRALRLVTLREPQRALYLRSPGWPARLAQATGPWPGQPRPCAADLSPAEAPAAPASAPAASAAGR